jgi:hypothetical protein
MTDRARLLRVESSLSIWSRSNVCFGSEAVSQSCVWLDINSGVNCARIAPADCAVSEAVSQSSGSLDINSTVLIFRRPAVG